MSFAGLRVAITGAGRDTGRLLAEAFASRGASVFRSARDRAAADFQCDLAQPDSVRAFAAALAERTDRLDVLIHNGAAYIEGADLADATDDTIESLMAGTTGVVLLTKHLLPLLRASSRPDIVNMISACGEVGHHRSGAHPAFYAAKHAHAGLSSILSHRLRPEGIRVISLFPPDFVQQGPREPTSALTASSIVNCVLFAVGQPRDCFIREFHFEQV
ncbi:short chain dehydrogenase [Asanoa hainanensis]|uniref:Short chain dehydrogenase n=1 Tax=Asanoa hainanensis TaxID=560556 RepID=A0A239MNB2_9ACTN|nr:SDR family oxidoreductase [Asanoa hainanensis]SNT44145.1 short chain dehydrogenase [Asanoa hainanensis]